MKQESIFRYPKSLPIYCTFLFVVGLAITFLFITSFSSEQIMDSVGLVMFSIVTILSGWLIFDSIQKQSIIFKIDDQGIRHMKGEKQIIGFVWNDIKEIKSRDILHRLEIHDRGGNKIQLEYFLENFPYLRELITRKILSLEKTTLQSEFNNQHHSYIAFLSAYFFTIIFLAFAYFNKFQGISILIFSGIALCSFIFPLFVIRKIVIEESRILVYYPVWKKIIESQQISKIQFPEIVKSQNLLYFLQSSTLGELLIKLSNGKTFKFRSLQGGVFAFYVALKVWSKQIELSGSGS